MAAPEMWNGFPIIDDNTDNDFTFDKNFGRGAVPRDYSVQPSEMMAGPKEFKVMAQDLWEGHNEVLQREEATMHHVILRARKKGRFIDCYQNGDPFCWSHSTTHGVMTAREVAHQPMEGEKPPKKLSAYMLACLSDDRGYQNKGGWSAPSAATAEAVGICSEEYWAEGKKSRSLDTPEMRANAALYKITEPMADLTKEVYFRNLPFESVITCMFSGRPVMVDFNWWSHAVLAVAAVLLEAGSWGLMILNSWGLGWGNQGFGILRGTRARPDGAVAVNTVRKVNAVFEPEHPVAV